VAFPRQKKKKGYRHFVNLVVITHDHVATKKKMLWLNHVTQIVSYAHDHPWYSHRPKI
jgi:hypothetical protein